MEELLYRLKKDIIETMNLDMKPEEVSDDAPIFGVGLGLDSIDALELIVMLEKNYKVKITDPEEAKIALVSVRALAVYIKEKTA